MDKLQEISICLENLNEQLDLEDALNLEQVEKNLLEFYALTLNEPDDLFLSRLNYRSSELLIELFGYYPDIEYDSAEEDDSDIEEEILDILEQDALTYAIISGFTLEAEILLNFYKKRNLSLYVV